MLEPKTKLLICLSSQLCTTTRWQSRQLLDLQTFANNEEGWAGFRAFVSGMVNVPVYLMVDAVEEDYRSETLPHTTGRARQEMVGRKRKQIFRTHYVSAWQYGRETDKRKDDKFLFTALTNPELLRPWVDILQVTECPLAGIYLLSMVSEILQDKFQLGNDQLLLITQHEAGLRQTYLENGKLRTSRLSPIDFFTTTSQTESLAAEVSKTRQYLSSLRLLPRDARLPVYLLDHHGVLKDLPKALESDPTVQCHYLGPESIVSRLQLPRSIVEQNAYALHFFALGLKSPGHNLAPQPITRNYWRHQMRRGLMSLSAATALVAIVWAGVNMLLMFHDQHETRTVSNLTAEQEAKYQEAARSFPAAPMSANNLRTAVEVAQQVHAMSKSPEQFMQVVSRALGPNPNVKLIKLGWTTSPSIPAVNSQGAFVPAGSEEGTIEGEIRPFRGDYRAAIASVNNFADTLKNDAAVAQVEIQDLPLNIDSSAPLSGNTTESLNQSQISAKFRMRLALKGSP